MTRSALARRIERERQAIDTDRKRIATLKTETLARLEQDGIGMTPEQLDGILYSAEGTELAQVMAVAENIKAIEKNLAQSLKGPDAGPEQIKAYTGFLMMSYRVYIEAIERTMRKIETVYLLELGEIIDEADTMMREADELSRRSSKTVEIAQNNLDINARTINTKIITRAVGWRSIRSSARCDSILLWRATPSAPLRWEASSLK